MVPESLGDEPALSCCFSCTPPGRRRVAGAMLSSATTAAMPEVSVDGETVRRPFSWASIQLTDAFLLTNASSRRPCQDGQSASGSREASTPRPKAPAPAAPAPEVSSGPPVPERSRRLLPDSAGTADLSLLEMALVANCHMSLVIFGALFLAVGLLLSVMAFRLPTSLVNDLQTRLAGMLFLAMAVFMCTAGLCLCRADQRRRHHNKKASDGQCPIHRKRSGCCRVLPSFQRVRRSTSQVRRSVLRRLDVCCACGGTRERSEIHFSSIDLLSKSNMALRSVTRNGKCLLLRMHWFQTLRTCFSHS